MSGNEPITPKTTYEDFSNMLLSIMEDLEEFDIDAIIRLYAYNGFSANNTRKIFFEMVKSVNDKTKSEDGAKDLKLLLGLYHAKGARGIANIKPHNVANIGVFCKLQQLVIKYKLKTKATKGDDITLPRLSLAFPQLSYSVYMSTFESLEHPVTDADISILGTQAMFPNFVPCLLSNLREDTPGLIFFIHTMYQCYVSYKYQLPKPGYRSKSGKSENTINKRPLDFMDNAIKYANLSFENSIANREEKVKFVEEYTKILSNVNMDHVKKAFIKFVDKPQLLEGYPPTKYHMIINCLAKYKCSPDVVEDLFDKSFREIEDIYSNGL